jgi:hypothetical protein
MLRARGVPAVGTFKGEIVYDRVSEMPSTVCYRIYAQFRRRNFLWSTNSELRLDYLNLKSGQKNTSKVFNSLVRLLGAQLTEGRVAGNPFGLLRD